MLLSFQCLCLLHPEDVYKYNNIHLQSQKTGSYALTFVIPFIKHMSLTQQQGALELTETITKPNTSLWEGKAAVRMLKLQLAFHHNLNTAVRLTSSSLKPQESLLKTFLMDTPLELKSLLQRAFKDALGGKTSALLAPTEK